MMLLIRSKDLVPTWWRKVVHIAIALVSNIGQSTFDQTRTFCVDVVNIQIHFIWKYTSPRNNVQMFHRVTSHSYKWVSGDADSFIMLLSNPNSIASVWIFVRGVNDNL